MEDFEKLVDDHQERQALEDQEIEMFGKILGKDELLAELDELTADVSMIPSAPTGQIDVIPNAPTNKIEVAQPEAEEEDKFEERMKKLEAA